MVAKRESRERSEYNEKNLCRNPNDLWFIDIELVVGLNPSMIKKNGVDSRLISVPFIT